MSIYSVLQYVVQVIEKHNSTTSSFRNNFKYLFVTILTLRITYETELQEIEEPSGHFYYVHTLQSTPLT